MNALIKYYIQHYGSYLNIPPKIFKVIEDKDFYEYSFFKKVWVPSELAYFLKIHPSYDCSVRCVFEEKDIRKHLPERWQDLIEEGHGPNNTL